MFIDHGYLQFNDESWVLDPALNLAQVPIPTSLEALIRSRVDNLPPELKLTIHCAAIIGRRFQASHLAEITEMMDVAQSLERLKSREIVRSVEDGEYWEFNHSLIESVVHDSLLKARRRQLHFKYAEILEDRMNGNSAEHAEEIAHHFIYGGAEVKALPYMVLAGEKAISRDANDEALIHLQRAADILDQQAEPDESLRWRIAVGLGDVYRFVGQYVESSAVLKSGLPLSQTGRLFRPQRAGLYRRLGETAQRQGEYGKARTYFELTHSVLGEPEQPQQQLEAARTFTGLAWVYFAQGRFDEARQACEDSKKYATKADSLSELAAADNLLGGIYYQLGEWHKALHHTTRAMVLREQMGYTWGVAATLSNLGILSFSAGHWSKALDFFHRSLTMRQEMGDVEGVTITNNNLGMVYREQGELEKAKVHFEESLYAAQQFDIAYHVANAHAGLASILLLEDDLTSAEEVLARGMAQAEAMGAQDIKAEMKRIQAEILLANHDIDGALDIALSAASLSTDLGNRSYESASWRIAAECSRQMGELDEALTYLEKASQALIEVKDDLEIGRVALQAFRIHQDAGDWEQAQKDLHTARQLFTSLGARLYLNGSELTTVESTL